MEVDRPSLPPPLASGSRASLTDLPAEVLLQIALHLGPRDTEALTKVSSAVRVLATSDVIWRHHVNAAVAVSPPPRSHNLTKLSNPPAPWEPRYDIIGPEAAAYREPWHATIDDLDEAATAKIPSMPPLDVSAFDGAGSMWEVWHAFVRPFSHLLGWWAGDVPSFGMLMRIIFDPHGQPAVPHAEPTGWAPKFVCQRVHIVNRLQGMGRMAEWYEVTDFPMPLGTHATTDGTSLRSNVSVDLCVPGVKVEDLWVMEWGAARDAYRQHSRRSLRPARLWPLPDMSRAEASQPDDSMHLDAGAGTDGLDRLDRDRTQRLDRLHSVERGDHGRLYVKHLGTGAVSTLPAEKSQGEPEEGTLELIEMDYRPYHNVADINSAFRTARLEHHPSPSLPIPTPGMLHIVPSGSDGRRADADGWSADTSIPSLIMLPSPAYRPYPHLSQPLALGPRFVPLVSPPLQPVRALPRLVETRTGASGSRPSRRYAHVPPAPEQDPSDKRFDWRSVEGLYGMSYGPWGIEVIYIRCRALTEADFDDDEYDHVGPGPRPPRWEAEPNLSSHEMFEAGQFSRDRVKPGARVLEGIKVTGDPHIPRGQVTFRAFIDDAVSVQTPWRAPAIDGANWMEAPETLDDGTVVTSFRQHTPWPYRSPSADHAAQPPTSPLRDRSPGLAVPGCGRLAGEGFVGADWVSAVVHISSPDEIRVWWHPMMCVAMARKLTAC